MLNVRSASTLTAALLIFWIAAAWQYPLLTLSENQALYTFSSEAQVIAAIYGLTITGYIFLRNQQDRLADRDETLAEILDAIQGEQYRFIAFITVVSLASILVALLAIICRESPIASIKLLTQNSAASLFSASLAWTGFFVLDAMRPGKIARASQAIKVQVEEFEQRHTEERGKLEEFLLNFNALEQLLDDFARIHLDRQNLVAVSIDIESSRRRSARSTWTKPRIVRALLSQEIIPPELANELIELIRYRNALVHGQDMTVSAEVVNRVKSVRIELEQRIQSLSGSSEGGDEKPEI